MARSSKAQNPIGIYVKDGVLRLGFVILYLICIYWSTEAVLKYLDEPAVTNVQYKNGDNEESSAHLAPMNMCAYRQFFCFIFLT